MRQILLFGAGKSSTALIHYFLTHAKAENWELIVADANLSAVEEKTGGSPYAKPVALDILHEDKRREWIRKADIVISLLPPALHFLVAKDCLKFKKNLLTASYVDEQIRSLQDDIEKAGLLFLCEMGLDPGIDHMSAKRLIDDIHEKGGNVVSFLSHCGGLVAPESDNNPWHYKISWNPRNVVMAGKAGAIYKQEGKIVELDYPALFETKRYVALPGHDVLCWYPNRDSLSYISTYGLSDTATFIRTTLRHPDFIYGWKNAVELKLTDETSSYDTDGKTLMQFYKEHLEANGFGEWLEQTLYEQFNATKTLLTELTNLAKLEEEAAEKGLQPVEEFMLVDDKGDLQKIDIDQLKVTAASALTERMHDANLTLKQLFYLGMDDNEMLINRGRCSAADVLQFALEKKLMLQPGDKDLVVMLHEIEHQRNGSMYKTSSTLLLEGQDGVRTAMAKTVGLPLAIAAKLILNGQLTCQGLQIPIAKEIYEPVLAELEKEGIVFREETLKIS